MRLRPFVLAFAALVIIPVVAIALTAQRAQIGVTILVNVTPNPLGYVHAPNATTAIVAKATLHDAPLALERVFEAQQLHFFQAKAAPMVAATQAGVRVEAEVTPNPTATLLTTNASGSTVTENVEAGVVTTFPCAYQVAVDTAVTSWQIKQGLSANFAGTTTSWPGGDLGNNTHIATPNPTATPFEVYTTDGSIWYTIGNTWSGSQVFCVDLTFDIPIATPQGVYSSNAIYTLYY
jgi:hypothetical protein